MQGALQFADSPWQMQSASSSSLPATLLPAWNYGARGGGAGRVSGNSLKNSIVARSVLRIRGGSAPTLRVAEQVGQSRVRHLRLNFQVSIVMVTCMHVRMITLTSAHPRTSEAESNALANS